MRKSKGQREKDRLRRRRLEAYYEAAVKPGPLCPRPYKQVFPSLGAANSFIAGTFPNDVRIESYVCVCGGVHIGHPAYGDRAPKLKGAES